MLRAIRFYIQAKTLRAAQDRFTSFMGNFLTAFLTWVEVDDAPEGEDFL